MRCLRCGCHRPRQHPDPLGLGLCAHHNQQFRDGTIGTDLDTRLRQHPIRQAQELLGRVVPPDEPLRHAGARIGVSKDVIHSIRTSRYTHIRSDAWEALQDAVADHEYTHPTPPPEPAPEQPTQLTLFDL